MYRKFSKVVTCRPGADDQLLVESVDDHYILLVLDSWASSCFSSVSLDPFLVTTPPSVLESCSSSFELPSK